MTMSSTRPMVAPSPSSKGSRSSRDTYRTDEGIPGRLGAEGGPDASRSVGHGRLALVFLARPEEAAEPVLALAGDHVDVQMRHALAHHVVVGHEAAVAFHGFRDGSAEVLDGAEGRPGQVVRW